MSRENEVSEAEMRISRLCHPSWPREWHIAYVRHGKNLDGIWGGAGIEAQLASMTRPVICTGGWDPAKFRGGSGCGGSNGF